MAVGHRAAHATETDIDRLRAEFAQLSAELQSGELQSDGLQPGELLAGDLRAQPRSATWAFAPLMQSIRRVLTATPTSAWPRLAISFNDDQIESKLWLLERFPTLEPSGRVVILGAWFGLLAILLDRLSPSPPAHMLCVDIDDEVCAVASRLLSVLPTPPAVLCADMMTLDYEALSAAGPTVFVNTSCEHLPDVAGWPTACRLARSSRCRATTIAAARST